MKISFVVPAYNEETRIGPCLDSILQEIKNSGQEAEVIVVNNHSTDRTGEVAAAYSGVKVVDEDKKGITKARQAGYLAAIGDLIANVDADNILPNGWIARVFAEFSREKNLVGLSGPFIYYDLSVLVNLEVKAFYFLAYLTYIINHFIFRNGSMLQGGNFVIKKIALDAIGGYNTKIDFYGEETDIARRLQKIGRLKFTFGLPMYSSGRRLSEEGVLLTGLRYAVNYFWVMVFGRPFSKKSTDVRYEEV